MGEFDVTTHNLISGQNDNLTALILLLPNLLSVILDTNFKKQQSLFENYTNENIEKINKNFEDVMDDFSTNEQMFLSDQIKNFNSKFSNDDYENLNKTLTNISIEGILNDIGPEDISSLSKILVTPFIFNSLVLSLLFFILFSQAFFCVKIFRRRRALEN